MISKGNNKTAAEKRWHETVAEWSKESEWLQFYFGAYCSNPKYFQLDHVLGSKAKRKVDGVSVKVGEWAVIPLPIELHDVANVTNNQFNRTLNPGHFRKRFGHEKQLFKSMVESMELDGIEIPFSDEILNAIVYG